MRVGTDHSTLRYHTDEFDELAHTRGQASTAPVQFRRQFRRSTPWDHISTEGGTTMTDPVTVRGTLPVLRRVTISAVLCVVMSPWAARADVVLDWNVIA